MFLAFFCTLSAQAAHGGAKLRVLSLCTAHVACEAFNNRLRGQTSDLPVQVEAAAFPQPPTSRDDVATADQMGASHKAAVVLWWRRGALVALMRNPDGARVLVRQVAPTALLGTAELEAGSLVARTTIVATLKHTPLGTPQPRQAGDAPDPTMPPHRAMLEPAWQLAPRVGGVVAWDGIPHEPSYGVEARIEGRWRGLGLGALWIERPTVRVPVPLAAGSLGSRLLGASFAYDFFSRERWLLGLEARFGWLTTRVDPQSGPFQESLKFVRGFAGVGVRVRRLILPGRLAVWMAGGLDRVADPINVGTRDANGYTPLWYMWASQPHLDVGLEVTFSH